MCIRDRHRDYGTVLIPSFLKCSSNVKTAFIPFYLMSMADVESVKLNPMFPILLKNSQD